MIIMAVINFKNDIHKFLLFAGDLSYFNFIYLCCVWVIPRKQSLYLHEEGLRSMCTLPSRDPTYEISLGIL